MTEITSEEYADFMNSIHCEVQDLENRGIEPTSFGDWNDVYERLEATREYFYEKCKKQMH